MHPNVSRPSVAGILTAPTGETRRLSGADDRIRPLTGLRPTRASATIGGRLALPWSPGWWWCAGRSWCRRRARSSAWCRRRGGRRSGRQTIARGRSFADTFVMVAVSPTRRRPRRAPAHRRLSGSAGRGPGSSGALNRAPAPAPVSLGHQPRARGNAFSLVCADQLLAGWADGLGVREGFRVTDHRLVLF